MRQGGGGGEAGGGGGGGGASVGVNKWRGFGEVERRARGGGRGGGRGREKAAPPRGDGIKYARVVKEGVGVGGAEGKERKKATCGTLVCGSLRKER